MALGGCLGTHFRRFWVVGVVFPVRDGVGRVFGHPPNAVWCDHKGKSELLMGRFGGNRMPYFSMAPSSMKLATSSSSSPT